MIEILSKEDREPELLEKIHDYLDCGVRYVWVIDPGSAHLPRPPPPQGELSAADGVLRTSEPTLELSMEGLLKGLP